MSADFLRIAGVDEAGRGPLAGGVTSAAVILDPQRRIPGLADSKRLSARRRAALTLLIKERALAWAVGVASIEEIDRLNILQASLLAMRRATLALRPAPQQVLVDGTHCPDWGGVPAFQTRCVVRGDASEPAISAASILAKQTRDEQMRILDLCYPGYGFAVHKGYPTAAHLRALHRLGPSPVHRRSFAPVRRLLPARLRIHRQSATPQGPGARHFSVQFDGHSA